MAVRSAAFLIGVIALTVIAFRALVGGEVDRLVSLHVLDKTQHQRDMLERNAARTFGLGSALDFPGFLQMARANRIAAVATYDTSGSLMQTRETADASVALSVTGDRNSDHAHQNHLMDHGAHQHDAPGAPSPAEVLAVLGKVPAMPAEQLQPLVEGDASQLLILRETQAESGAVIDYAQIVLPVRSASGLNIGYAGFTIDVSHFTATMSEGMNLFGALLVFCGGSLFLVPAFGFWLQRKLANRSSRDVQYLSQHDPLTGLLNRSAFVAQAEDWRKDDKIAFAAYIDADRFKLINDTYGHNVGDSFLRHVAKLLTSACGPGALVARFGGDEFTFALPRDEELDIAAMMDDLIQAATTEVEIDGFTFSSSLSIGLASPEPEDTLETLLQRADTALYFAKSGGRNQAAFYIEEMGARARRRRVLELRLRDACAANDFLLVYQPLVDAQSGDTIGYEALLRLNDNDGTAIAPAEFVPLAEEIGLIEDIGTWVLRAATKETAALDDHSVIAVNLSAEQFKSGKLVGLVIEALADSGLPPERLELEITESILLDQNMKTAYQIDALKDMGVSIAMDDFGTGFSSLSTLWRYGFDRIKIDKSFVAALEETPARTTQLIDSIVLLGSRMGMHITAEGIETGKQRDILTGLGCHVLQGFYFGVPEPLSLPEIKSDSRLP